MSATTAPAPPYRPTPFETAVGWLPGHVPAPRTSYPNIAPLPALERALLPALQRSPCVVAFSGGRDSSAMLAVAVSLARREGLPLPIAVTLRYPGRPDLDETSWQEQVIRHLGVTDWELISIADEHDAVGPWAQRVHAALGLTFPAAAHTREIIHERARGGAVITGEGGDEILAVKRGWMLATILARRGRIAPGAYRSALASMAPAVWRERAALRRAMAPRPWLRESVAAQSARLVARETAQIPFDYRAATLRLLDRRALIEGLRTFDLLAARHDVTLVHPLLDRQFVASWARFGGRLGATSRTASMTTLFGALLPADICARRSKAVFNSAIFGAHARSFAEQWDGGNVDPDLVDPERLRAEWLSEQPHGGSLLLLQQAFFGPQPDSAIA